jgi:hypothetical protein
VGPSISTGDAWPVDFALFTLSASAENISHPAASVKE